MPSDEYSKQVAGVIRRYRAKLDAIDEAERANMAQLASVNTRLIFLNAAGKVPEEIKPEVLELAKRLTESPL